jgi:hypothetical protein
MIAAEQYYLEQSAPRARAFSSIFASSSAAVSIGAPLRSTRA